MKKSPVTINDMAVGDIFQSKRIVTKDLIKRFAKATGYLNPIHLDEDFAKKTVFGKLVGQGSLTTAILFGVMGTEWPGVGTIPVSQSLHFRKPVLADDELTVRLRILELDADRNRVRLATVCLNQKGDEVMTGEAVVLAPN